MLGMFGFGWADGLLGMFGFGWARKPVGGLGLKTIAPKLKFLGFFKGYLYFDFRYWGLQS